MPALVGELLEAVDDDLTPVGPDEARSQLEAEADTELRVVESVERCKAVLDAVGLEALARLRSTIESSELARFADLGRTRPAGWIDADELTAMEVGTATGLGTHDVRARLALATAPTRGAVSLYRACTIQSEIAALPVECGPDVVDAVLRPKDGAPPSPTLFRQRLTRACLAADREAADRRRRARRPRGAQPRQRRRQGHRRDGARRRHCPRSPTGRRSPRPGLAPRRRHHRHPHVRLAREQGRSQSGSGLAGPARRRVPAGQ